MEQFAHQDDREHRQRHDQPKLHRRHQPARGEQPALEARFDL
jgi:hypothetical protein